jgi:hypothetical protein
MEMISTQKKKTGSGDKNSISHVIVTADPECIRSENVPSQLCDIHTKERGVKLDMG